MKIRKQSDDRGSGRYPGRIRRDAVAVYMFLIAVLPGVTGAAEKPELEISEVVIEASAPALTGGRKDPVTILETQAATLFVSDTVQRLGADAPDLLPAPDEPVMEPSGGCLAPFLGLGVSVRGRMARAAKAWEAMRWQAVVDELTPVATHSDDIPEKPEAYYFIGRSKHYLGDISGAANAYEQLRTRYPDHPMCEHALYALSWIYLENGNPGKALEVLSEFERRFPGSGLMPYARYLGAAIMNRQGRYTDALDYLEGIIAGYPLFDHLPEVQFWIAENQYFTGRFEAAQKNYDLYLQNYPGGINRAEALYGRAFGRLEQKQYAAAMADFKLLLEEFKDHPLAADAAFQAGKLAVFLKQEGAASTFFMDAIARSRGETARTLEARAWLDYEAEKFPSAARMFSEAAVQYAESGGDADPRRTEMRFLTGLAEFRAGEYRKAADRFEALAADTDTEFTPAALANAGVAWLKLRRLDRALERLREALDHPKPLRGRSLYMLYTAEVLFRLGRYDASIEMFNAMASADDAGKYSMEILRGLAWNHYGTEDWENAARYFDRVAREFPDGDHHAEALLRHAECLFNMGEYDRAKTAFNALIAEYPLHPEAFEARLLNARADWIRGEYDRGMAALTEALRFAPDPDARQRVRMTIGELLQEQGRYEEAIEQLRQAVLEAPGGPGAPAALLKQADNLYNLGRYDESAEVYRRITREYEDSAEAGEAQYSIGLTYFQRNRLDEYLAECREVAARHPGTRQSALALQGAAAILVEQERFDEAAAIQKQLLADYASFVDTQLIQFRLGETLLAAEDYGA
ncbi:MAG TPA: tetratricopeptide repeat protein, partial [bacterium]|nr:tetratricopeptide repeat protein [bacterium]